MRSTVPETMMSGVPNLHIRRAAARVVELHVADLDASQAFYSSLLGLVESAAAGTPGRRLMVSPDAESTLRSLALTQGPAPSASNALLLELESTAELLDRYLIAKLLNAPATPLVSVDGCLTASIRDPDGHRIELRSVDSSHPISSPAQRSRWGRADKAVSKSAEQFGRPRGCADTRSASHRSGR